MAFYWLQMYFVQQLRKTYSRLSGSYTLKQPICDKWAMTAVASIAAHEPIKALLPEKIVEHVRAKVIVSTVHQPHFQLKRSNDQQILALSPVKRLKTTTTTFDRLQQPCIIATTTTTTPDMKSALLTTQQPRTMTVSSSITNESILEISSIQIRRIGTTTEMPQQTTYRLATMPSSHQSQQFIIATTSANLPIAQTTSTRSVDDSTIYDNGTNELTGCLVTTSSQQRPSFVRPTLPTNVLRLTVVRK